MKKHIIPTILVVTAIIASFLAGLFYGRKLSSSPIQVNTIISERPATPSGSAESGLLVNINTATEEELTALPGIGDVLAKRIVEYREQNGPFASSELLLNVEGISRKRFDAIKDYITTGD